MILKKLPIAISLCLAMVVSVGQANAGHPHYYGACSKHARLMLHACFADRQDSYLVHRADCVYVNEAENTRNCLQEARMESLSDAEECLDVYEARQDLCNLVGQQRYDIEFETSDFIDPNEIGNTVQPNQYWPLTAGHTHVIVSESEDDEGEIVKEVVVVTATAEVREVGGIPCRVIRDMVFEEEEGEYSAVEITQDWYAQIGVAGASRGIGNEGDTVYCGENTFEVEDDLVDNTDGSFAHGTARAKAGFLVRQFPVPGSGDRQEMASDEAEDYVRYESLGATPSASEGGDLDYPLACNDNCLKTYEVNPRDPGAAEYKYYRPGTGFVLATKLDENGEPTGEREEVSCVKDSLEDALNAGAECGIGFPEELLAAICAWAPEAEWLPDELCD